MLNTYKTASLILVKITLKDAPFIHELVNTPEWIEFIGNRNINNLNDAKHYVKKIIDDKSINYWVVKLQETQIPIGVITLLKRSHLDYFDIGFAFLNQYKKQGFAFEASSIIAQKALEEFKTILAVTMPSNKNSIKLLEKLDFQFDKEIEYQHEKLLVYRLSV
nr:GNAT family N-acetyltransferase [Pelobium sp.]